MNDLGSYLNQKREERELSIRQLAQLIDVSHSYISQLENNKRDKPKPLILRALADGLNVPYIELLEKAGHIEEAEKEGLLKSAEEFRKHREKNNLADITELNEGSFNFNDIIDASYLNTNFIYEGETLEKDEKIFIANVLRTILQNDIPVDNDERTKIVKLIETLLK